MTPSLGNSPLTVEEAVTPGSASSGDVYKNEDKVFLARGQYSIIQFVHKVMTYL